MNSESLAIPERTVSVGLPFPVPRFVIVAMCALLHLFFGTVYAWSFFQVLLVQELDWTFTDTALAFSIAIFCLGVAASVGGFLLPKYGPRILAMLGSALFACGYFIAGWALENANLWVFYLGYGVVGGIGLGFGYVTPVATAAKWYPQHKGLATGTVIMGFGFGAFILSKLIAPILLVTASHDLSVLFTYLGVTFAVILLPASIFVVDPPKPQLSVQAASVGTEVSEEDEPGYLRRCLLSQEFFVIWLILFFCIVAGLAVISFQSPLLQDVWQLSDPAVEPEQLALYGATLIAISSLFNGLGRLFWSMMSDWIGRVSVIRILLGSQLFVFGVLMTERNPWVYSVLVCYILLCFGGGFAVVPALISDVFGEKKMSAIYGLVLTSWSVAGLVGPMYVGYFKDSYPDRAVIYCFLIGAGFLVTGLIVSMLFDGKRARLKKPSIESTLTEFQIPYIRSELSRL